MQEVLEDLVFEYHRMIEMAIPPTVVFQVIGRAIPFIGKAPAFNPLFLLGLLTIVSCLYFDDGTLENGFLNAPQNNVNRALRFLAIKLLEILSELISMRIIQSYPEFINYPFVNLTSQLIMSISSWAYTYLLSIMTLCFIRGLSLFPLMVIALIRVGGRDKELTPWGKLFIYPD